MTRLGLRALVAATLGLAHPAWAEGGGGHGASGGEASGHGAAAPRSRANRMTLPVSPVSLIEGSRSAWSVSDTEAGCYLMSPARRNSSRVALGRHPQLGLGLLAVNIGLAVAGPAQSERIAVQAADGALARDGRMVGAAVLFMPLSQVELDQVLRTLAADGRLWLVIREAWLSHAGLDAPAAMAAFRTRCDASSPAPPPAAPAPLVAGVGSKSASAP